MTPFVIMTEKIKRSFNRMRELSAPISFYRYRYKESGRSGVLLVRILLRRLGCTRLVVAVLYVYR
jgi:hypothetical protein